MSTGRELHVLFFPLMAPGHMIPTLDLAKLFASSHGVRSTIVTTPYNQPFFSKPIQTQTHIEIRLLPEFPGVRVGLPGDCQRLDQVASDEELPRFFEACALLQEPFEQLLEEVRPDCVVADMFFPWATEAAAKFGIPRLVFHGIGCFPLCALHSLRTHKPFQNVSSDSESFVLPGLPHRVSLTRLQVPPSERRGSDDGGDDDSAMSEFMKRIWETEETSYGVIFNSFYELEPDYAEHYKNVLGRRSWFVGPLSLGKRDMEHKAEIGKMPAIDEKECLEWMDSKKPDSVVYICFGSLAKFSGSQLREMATGVEDSGQEFIWVLRSTVEEEKEWMPEGFEERTRGKGLIIRGWAPQVLILDHGSVGAFVTHCGWNSTLEGVCAGVPMVTWPVLAEQFANEKMVTDILRTGVGVGSKEWTVSESDGVKGEAVAEAIKRVMIGEESEEMRGRAKALKEKARKAVKEGGSSYSDLSALLDDLRAYSA